MCTTTQNHLHETPLVTVTTNNKRPLIDLVAESATEAPPATKNRRIRFPDELVTCYHTIPSRTELSTEELEQCYYKKKDLKIFKNDAINAMRRHELTMDTDTGDDCTSGFCPRGLERRSRQGAKKFRHNKTKGWRAVFLEQARQRRDTAVSVVNGMVWLAKVYQEVTQPSLCAAQELAAQDAQEAAQIHSLQHSQQLTTTV